MSAPKLFPPFQPVEPTTLAKAIQELAKIHTGSGTFNSTRWEQLLEKVRQSTRLSNFEKIHMACNCGAIPQELRGPFSRLFRSDLEEDVLNAASQAVSLSLAPGNAIELLTHDEIRTKFGTRHLPAGVFGAAMALGRDSEEQTWIDSEVKRSADVLSLVNSLKLDGLGAGYTSGQMRIIRRILQSRETPKILNQQFSGLFSLLSALKGESIDRIQLVDEILGNYFSFDPTWTTKVLDDSYFLGKLLTRLPSLSSERLRLHQYKNIELLRQKIEEITNVLRELNEVEPDRGNFWKKYLSLCHYVEPKRLDKRSVAVAFAFPGFVIVEFAPVGTSALLYNRQAFDTKVRNTKNWRDLESVMTFSPYTGDGRLLHMTGWQGKFNEVIVLLLRKGGSIR